MIRAGQTLVYAPAEPWLQLRRGETCFVRYVDGARVLVAFEDDTRWQVRAADLRTIQPDLMVAGEVF